MEEQPKTKKVKNLEEKTSGEDGGRRPHVRTSPRRRGSRINSKRKKITVKEYKESSSHVESY